MRDIKLLPVFVEAEAYGSLRPASLEASLPQILDLLEQDVHLTTRDLLIHSIRTALAQLLGAWLGTLPQATPDYAAYDAAFKANAPRLYYALRGALSACEDAAKTEAQKEAAADAKWAEARRTDQQLADANAADEQDEPEQQAA